MEVPQSFNKGMNKDLAKSLYSPDQYFHAENWNLVTKIGLSTGTLRNTLGNELNIIIPDCSNVSQIRKSSSWSSGADSITVNGIPVAFSNTENWAEEFANAVNAEPLLQAIGIHAHYSSTQVVLYSLLLNNALITSTIVTTYGGSNFDINDSYVPAQLGNKIIGWESIRESIFIFTTNEVTLHSPISSYGQIWKITYDKVSLQSTISLVYNNQLNFTIWHPIPNPGGTKGNFETPGLQKLYWTDNYNPPREINTVDANTMALTVSQLENTPDLINSNNIVQEIFSGGNILTGVYQACVRLKKTQGAESNFNITGNPIHIVGAQETTSGYTQYMGQSSGSTVSKSIKYRFYNLDTDYTRAEIVIIYRSSPSAVPDINIVNEQSVPSNGIIDFIYTGNEQKIPITLDQFQEENLVFSTVKTIESKNNYLFYGNVKYGDFDVIYDARAYRFPAAASTNYIDATHTRVHDAAGNPSTVDISSPFGIPETHDSINPAQNPFSWNNYLYQSDGATLGGQGPNITYSFINEDIFLDSNVISGNWDYSYANVSKDSTTYSLSSPSSADSDYPHVNTFRNFHSPYIYQSLRGYTRDEIYRFGIVFYSKKGLPSFVHWIADIRMPHVWMPDTASINDYDRTVQFPTCTTSDNINYSGKSLGILFTVNNLNGIQEQISGYSIVRVKREQADRTILGQGALYPALYDNATSTGVYLVPNDTIIDTGAEDIDTATMSLNSPEFLFGNPPNFGATDTIDVVGVLNQVQTANAIDSGGTPLGSSKKIRKNYTFSGTCSPITNIPAAGGPSNNPYVLSEIVSLDSANKVGYSFTFNTVPGLLCWNRSETLGGAAVAHASMGSKTLALRTGFFSNFTQPGTGGDGFAATDGCTTSGGIYIANYRRPLLVQYGGNSFQQRSNNEYISTGNYQVVLNINASTSFTDKVYGGDTFICMFDNVKNFANARDHCGNYADCCFVGRIFPVETTYNIDLRENVHGAVLNKSPLCGAFWTSYCGSSSNCGNLDRIDVDEDFILNSVYSTENDINKFIPKPDPYLPVNKFDVRVHRSQIKTNGELVDSWGVFKEDDYIDLDTTQGELNNLIVHQDHLIGFQDKGISIVTVNERALIQDTTGQDLNLGTAEVLSRYDYISKVIGSKHQFGFTKSNDSVFFFDVNTKNIYRLQGNQPTSLSVVKGLSSYLNNNLNGILQINDNPYTFRGLTATYDHKYNEAVFTFRDTIYNRDNIYQASVTSFEDGYMELSTFQGIPCVIEGAIIAINYVLNGEQIIEEFVVTDISGSSFTIYNPESQFPGGIENIQVYCTEQNRFTLAFNDIINAFTSFYSYTPPVYINNFKNIWSPSDTLQDLWIHDIDNTYSIFYGTIYPTRLTMFLNFSPTEKKVWDNFQIESESLDNAGVQVPGDFFDSIRVYNENQDSDVRLLPGGYTRYLERFTNIAGIRNRMSYQPSGQPDILLSADPNFAERMRSPWIFVDLVYNNTNGYSFQVNSFKSFVRKSIR